MSIIERIKLWFNPKKRAELKRINEYISFLDVSKERCKSIGKPSGVSKYPSTHKTPLLIIPEYTCDLCGESFKSFSVFTTHLEVKHGLSGEEIDMIVNNK